jgi:ATP-dependent helicase/nuclease subunit B
VDWDSWLESLWLQRLRSGDESRLLLSPAQEHETWVRLVKPEIEGRRLISIDGVADLAQEAYALLCGYDAREFMRTRMLSADVDSFCEWARGFEEQCRVEQWLSRSMLPLTLAEALRQPGSGRPLNLPTHVALAGFDRVRPAEQRLISALEDAGCSVERVEIAHRQTEANMPANRLVEAADTRDEITTCAWWVRRSLEAAAGKNKPVRIAVIVPDLSRVRGEMERIFRQVLAATSVPIGAQELPIPFEFSLGVPLAEVPAARAALLLLRWMDEALDPQELSWLMLSGFLWRTQADLLPMAALDAAMRGMGVLLPEYPLSAYLQQRGWRDHVAVESMRNRLHAARQAWWEGRGETLTFAQWVERADRILTAAGWPGPHRMQPEDFQAQRKWSQLLDSIAALAFDARRVSYREFLRVLTRQAGQTIFSPQSTNAAVEILGPFEAAGMQWDAIWFLGVDDARWPAPARPHPFLTKALQKDRGMPHADLRADWEIAKLVTERVQTSAPQCILSYPKQDEEGEQRASTAIGGPLERVSAAWMRAHLGVADTDLEDLREFPPLAIENEDAKIVPWPKEQDAGGYGTLKMQAECPFQAFATMRLNARELDRADWGLDPAERGRVVHRTLERIWGEIKDRNTLINAKAAGRLREIIETHVHQALARYGTRETIRKDGAEGNQGDESGAGDSEQEKWRGAYLEAEGERVVELVEEWLAYEERRAPFVVAQQEQKLSANVGELKLKLRADRIDEIEGGRLLIDYKTGKVSLHGWEGERPDEPQLPLYAAYGNVRDLRGVLLAQIRSGDHKFEGCVEEPGRTLFEEKSRLSPYSEQLRQQWERILLALGKQFLNGEAQVDPKQYPNTCEFCALPGLCRVAEMKLEQVETMGGAIDDAQGGADAS